MPNALRSSTRLIFGLAVITMGVLFTLDSLGLMDARVALRWAPTVLIAFGITRVLGFGCHPAPISGTLIALTGSWLLLNTLHIIDRNVLDLWPILLIVWGVAIVSGRGKYFGFTHRRWKGWRTYDRYPPAADVNVGVSPIGKRRDESGAGATDPAYSSGQPYSGSGAGSGPGPGDAYFGSRGRHEDDSSPHFHSFAFMGSVARKVVTQEFRGGEIEAMMGGGDIDLRSAHMANGTARLEINLIMGGVNLFVPEDWSVEYQGAPIMGSVEDRSKRPPDASKGRLIITGIIVMSSVIIRN